MTATYQDDAFGAVKTKTGTGDTAYRFTGELQDSQTGRSPYYLRARYYDPALGRFLGRDPLTGFAGMPQSLNRYIYALNNPILLADPLGLTASEGGGFHSCQATPTPAPVPTPYCGPLPGTPVPGGPTEIACPSGGGGWNPLDTLGAFVESALNLGAQHQCEIALIGVAIVCPTSESVVTSPICGAAISNAVTTCGYEALQDILR